MQKNFVTVRNILEDMHPQLVGHIRGENYPLTQAVQAMVTVAGLMQTMGIIFIFMGKRLFDAISTPEPEWYTWVQNNKMMSIASLFLVNSVVQQQAATGAFEITYNGETVFSKLETGRMPNMEEILEGLSAAGLTQ